MQKISKNSILTYYHWGKVDSLNTKGQKMDHFPEDNKLKQFCYLYGFNVALNNIPEEKLKIILIKSYYHENGFAKIE